MPQKPTTGYENNAEIIRLVSVLLYLAQKHFTTLLGEASALAHACGRP